MPENDLVPRELIGVSHVIILATGLLANLLVIFILAITKADRLQCYGFLVPNLADPYCAEF